MIDYNIVYKKKLKEKIKKKKLKKNDPKTILTNLYIWKPKPNKQNLKKEPY
jgi:mRNA-degrading endonuclease YafQ of YafQ-DinJ toxin-antitoxin module